MKLRDCENFWVLGLFLGAVGLISAAVLAWVSGLTAPLIARSAEQTKSAALRQLGLPEFDNSPTSEIYTSRNGGREVRFMAVRKAGKLVAFAAESEIAGYAGEIKELVGLSRDGKILAVLVTEERETPGLGKSVCERKFKRTIFNFFKPLPSGLPPNEILDQFTGRRKKGKEKWAITRDGGDFNFRTGATVTSRAITTLTGDIAGIFARDRKAIMSAFGEEAVK